MLKINGEAVAATEFAYDGCHKIYLIFTEADRAHLLDCGYTEEGDILPVSELPEVWSETCPLRFISGAGPDYKPFVEQCEEGTVTWE